MLEGAILLSAMQGVNDITAFSWYLGDDTNIREGGIQNGLGYRFRTCQAPCKVCRISRAIICMER